MSATPYKLRASEQTGLIVENRDDFVLRKEGLTPKQMYELSLAALVIILGVTFLVMNSMREGSIICVVVGIVLLIFAKQIEKYQKILQATEFMNALFSSALSADHKFCAVASKTGEIVYLDRPFQALFPEMIVHPERTLDALFTLYKASDVGRQAILQSLQQGTESKQSLQMEGGTDRQPVSLMISIKPIERPQGFFLVRGQ